ncbi:hypothetical protein BX616_010415, partial [Lobosporangium transversale]
VSIHLLIFLSFAVLILQQYLFFADPSLRHTPDVQQQQQQEQQQYQQTFGSHSNDSNTVGIEFLVSLTELLGLNFALVLTVQENKRSFLASNTLLIFWLLSSLVSAIKLHTLASSCPGGDNNGINSNGGFFNFAVFKGNDHSEISWSSLIVEQVIVSTRLILALLVFALECIRKDTRIQLGDESELETCPEEEANIFSHISFHWVTDLMRKGYIKPLTMDDLWGLRRKDRSQHVSRTFVEIWGKEIKKKKPSLPWALTKAFGGPFFVGGVLKLISDCLSFVQPLLLREMLRFVISYKTDTPQPLYRGYYIAGAMFCCGLLQSAVTSQYFHQCIRTGMHFRTAMVTALYQKSMRLSNSARHESTVGEIVNHMSIDAQRIQDLISYLHVLWSGIFQISVTLYLLYLTLGWATFAGLGVMILMIPLNARLGIIQQRFQEKHMTYKDSRIKLMNELLNGIRVIKLYAWEGTFLQKILSVRNDQELRIMKKLGYISAIQMFTWASTPVLVSLLNFAVYTMVMKKTLTTDILFAAIALFNLLQFPLSALPWVISSVVDARVSFIRVQKFLQSAEVDPDAIIVEDRSRQSSSSNQDAADKYALLATDASYSWYKSSPPVVSGINLALKQDCLLSVIGRVGSGKSSLIAALCGDLEHVAGEIRVRGSIALVPQQAWIMNDTLRANILFGAAYDPVYYQKTIEACCLQQDFEMLLGGDMTEIGERGINLSGGQKARISLARAVYARADIYLLDDPLSAVDAHVGRTIFDKVIGPRGLLAGKVRVFVTHQIQYLAQSTTILMLREGKVVEQGNFQELMNKKADVFQLISEFGRDKGHRNKQQGAIDGSSEVENENDVVTATATPSSTRRGSISSIRSSRTARRSSTESSRDGANVRKGAEVDKDKKNNIIVEEEMKQGSVHRVVYWAYAKACSFTGVLFYIISMVCSQSTQIGMSLWLTYWSRQYDASKGGDDSKPPPEAHDALFYIGVYAFLGLTYTLLTVFQTIILQVYCAIRASRVLHEKMFRSVLRSPMSFFDTTPLGRILNRFSKDQSTIDEVLPRSFWSFAHNVFGVMTILTVILFSTPALIIVIIPFTLFYVWLQRYFLATSRELRRLDSVSRSPIFAHFQETLGGISTIRAYRQQDRFIHGNESRLDKNLRAFYPSAAGNRWLAFRLECLSSVIIFGSAFLSVVSLSKHLPVDPGLVGLSLTYALNITQTLNWMIRMYTEVETNIVAVERLQEYVNLPSEAPEIIEDHRPPQEWPDHGQIEFKDYETRYRPGLELVLRGVNCLIRPREKIGICGRTGAGKSSLTLSLFRIIEAVKGQIFVDGIDISTLGLYDVRSRFSIIPQDPVLFAGTIRFNLDPLGTKSDLELWQALEDSYLKDYVMTMEGGLNAMVLEGGDNFSVGQRQLICLARALLRKTSVLVLDEATAAIDLETDALVQAIIRQKLKDCTILTIAHRIDTVMDSDRIMVLDQGRVAEFDSPKKLLENPQSMFYSLARESGNH